MVKQHKLLVGVYIPVFSDLQLSRKNCEPWGRHE